MPELQAELFRVELFGMATGMAAGMATGLAHAQDDCANTSIAASAMDY